MIGIIVRYDCMDFIYEFFGVLLNSGRDGL